jgi:hypothetical protein
MLTDRDRMTGKYGLRDRDRMTGRCGLKDRDRMTGDGAKMTDRY